MTRKNTAPLDTGETFPSPIGRLIWQDVLGLVQYVKAHA